MTKNEIAALTIFIALVTYLIGFEVGKNAGFDDGYDQGTVDAKVRYYDILAEVVDAVRGDGS